MSRKAQLVVVSAVLNNNNQQLPHVRVAVGVIFKNNLFFVCRRKAHQHQGNKWEFPGGKINPDETNQDALARELQEEIGIKVVSSKPLNQIDFDYSDKKVSLYVYLVDDFDGEARGAEGQESKWVNFTDLQSLTFPDANVAIIDALKLLQP